MTKLILPILTGLIFVGCSGTSKETPFSIEDEVIDLVTVDTLYNSSDLYFQAIDVKGDFFILNLINEKEDAFIIIRFEEGVPSVVRRIRYGQGPQDIVSGKILTGMANYSDNSFVVYDNNTGKILTIDPMPDTEILTSVNENIIQMQSPCFNDSLTVGHKLYSEDQFTIINGAEITNVAPYLEMSRDMHNRLGDHYDFMMSNSFAVNPIENRILSISYFFNCIAAYTLDGKFIRASQHETDITKEIENREINEKYWVYSQPFAKDTVCYVKATRYVNDKSENQYLLKLNWNGEILSSYRLPDTAQGYAIGEEKDLYCVISYNQGEEEVYSIVRYRLP